LVAASALAAGSETVMSEAAHLTDRHACGGRHRGREQAHGIITPRAAITALPWPGETLPVAAVRRGIPLAAAGPFAAAFRACPIGHLAIRLTTQP
jgi:hypothetical protein